MAQPTLPGRICGRQPEPHLPRVCLRMLSVLGSEMSLTNRQLRLQSRPKRLLAPGDLQLLEAPVPELKDGQALVRVKYLSIDPTMRVWMAADTYLPPVTIGEVKRAIGFADVVHSRHPDCKNGDRVMGLTGLQDYVVLHTTANPGSQQPPTTPFSSYT